MQVNNTYTLIVKFLRVLLPTLALLSIVILVIWPILNQEDVPDDVGPAIIVDKPIGVSDDALQMIKPEFTGLDAKSRPYVITAETVFQGSTKEADMTLVKPVADLELSSTQWVSLRADGGIYRPSKESLILTGAVTLSDNTGYHIETNEIEIDLNKGTAISKSMVTGNGPIGTIKASGMRIAADQSPFVTFIGPSKFVLYPEAVE